VVIHQPLPVSLVKLKFHSGNRRAEKWIRDLRVAKPSRPSRSPTKPGRRQPTQPTPAGANRLVRRRMVLEPNLRQPILSAGDLAFVEDLRPVYADFLASLTWDFFLTVTFREPVPMRRQESVTHAVGQTIKARYETVDNLALFAEPHLSRNLHLHGLVHLQESTIPTVLDAARQDMQQYLGDKFGRSQAAFPRGRAAVSKYVAKYCVKTDGYYELF